MPEDQDILFDKISPNAVDLIHFWGQHIRAHFLDLQDSRFVWADTAGNGDVFTRKPADTQSKPTSPCFGRETSGILYRIQ